MYDIDLMGDTDLKPESIEKLTNIIAQTGEGFFDLVNQDERRKFAPECADRHAGRPVTWGLHRLFFLLVLVEAVRRLHGTSASNACHLLSKKRCLPIIDPKGKEVLFATPGAIVGRDTNLEQLRYHHKNAKRLYEQMPGLTLKAVQAYAGTLAERCKKPGR